MPSASIRPRTVDVAAAAVRSGAVGAEVSPTPPAASDELLLVCGSFYILKDVRAALGLADPSDDLEAAPVVPAPTRTQKAAASEVATP